MKVILVTFVIGLVVAVYVGASESTQGAADNVTMTTISETPVRKSDKVSKLVVHQEEKDSPKSLLMPLDGVDEDGDEEQTVKSAITKKSEKIEKLEKIEKSEKPERSEKSNEEETTSCMKKKSMKKEKSSKKDKESRSKRSKRDSKDSKKVKQESKKEKKQKNQSRR